jgi:hypothetical protein
MSTPRQALSLLQPAQRDASPQGGTKTAAWMLLCITATLVGVVSLRYLLPHIPFAVPSSNFLQRRPWLVTHAASASIALIVGPWQFLSGLRKSRKHWHRRIGWVYLIAVLIGWLSSIPVAMHAQAGPVSQAGFLALGAAWITTSLLGLLAAVNREFEKHRRWMIRSYALTAAAITLRIMLPISIILGVPFKYGYPFIAWACWLFNICCAEYLLKMGDRSLAEKQMHFTAPVCR